LTAIQTRCRPSLLRPWLACGRMEPSLRQCKVAIGTKESYGSASGSGSTDISELSSTFLSIITLAIVPRNSSVQTGTHSPTSTMQSLLRWSIENSPGSSGSAPPAHPPKPLDTGLIDYLLGPSPYQQMVDALVIATDETVDEGEDEDDEDESTARNGTRMQALANLEMV
jgi:hypothetical protein